jgi:hypothetical protein
MEKISWMKAEYIGSVHQQFISLKNVKDYEAENLLNVNRIPKTQQTCLVN